MKRLLHTKRAGKSGIATTSGFTLLELLIVIVIIGVLATIGIGSFISSQEKARDAQRKSDLKNLSTALEIYYNDHDQYPLSDASGQILGCGAAACSWGGNFVDAQGTVYMAQMPADPSEQTYFYSSTGDEYQLYARLETEADPVIPRGASGAVQSYVSTQCGSLLCNYGVTSTNSTLNSTVDD